MESHAVCREHLWVELLGGLPLRNRSRQRRFLTSRLSRTASFRTFWHCQKRRFRIGRHCPVGHGAAAGSMKMTGLWNDVRFAIVATNTCQFF